MQWGCWRDRLLRFARKVRLRRFARKVRLLRFARKTGTDMEITKHEIREIYAIMGNLGIRDMKEDVVLGASEGRTSSMRELTREEAVALAASLRSHQAAAAQAPRRAESLQQGENKRRRILSICYQLPSHLGFTRYDAQKQRHVIDTGRLNDFLCGPKSICKKPLNRHTPAELSKVIVQFESMLKGYLK